jgi:hypothetical protein
MQNIDNIISNKRILENKNEIDNNKKVKLMFDINELKNTNSLTLNNDEFKNIIPQNPPNITKFLGIIDEDDIQKYLGKKQLLTDITMLLKYPQKIAAFKLGMSEAWLCKEFKSSVGLKWPHRQLCKIERNISICKNIKELQVLSEKKFELLAPQSVYVRRYYTTEEFLAEMNK